MQNPTSSVAQVIQNTKTLNTSDSDIKNTNTKTLAQVRHIADKLVVALNNPSRYEYYCKVAWRLPEGMIWNYLEQSAKGREPAKLFSWLCKQDMRK